MFYGCQSLNFINLQSSLASIQYLGTNRLFTQAVREITPQNMTMWSKIKDEEDRLPLATSAALSQKWSDIEPIFAANKLAIYETDEVTGLPLCLLAAVGLDSDIESVYRLLKEYPPALMHFSLDES